jgi:F0F1-type ATP synthase membrane subunit b/b'
MHTLFLQVETPPSDFLGFLLWFVGILVAVVATMFYLLKAAMQSRIDDRDQHIATLREEKKAIEAQRDSLIEEVKSSFDVANAAFQRVIENLQK